MKTSQQIYMDGYKAARAEASRDWRAFVADQILGQVEREAVTAHEIDCREAFRVIKWLTDHLDECLHTTLYQTDGNLLLTTMDNVEAWLSDMAGVLGAEGFKDPEEGDE